MIKESKSVRERASDIEVLANRILEGNNLHYKVDYVGGVVSQANTCILKVCCSSTKSDPTFYLDVQWPMDQDETNAFDAIERFLTIELPKKARKIQRLTRVG
jgi:hypothetical protein